MDKHTIVVRDRRKPNHYRIQNIIFKEWLPIIGLHGYTLYSLYALMATEGEETAWPGYQLIESFLDVSSSTIARYNRLLEWCGLVEIVRFESALGEANHYYLLDEPVVTHDGLYAIRQAAIARYGADDPFVVAVCQRIEQWRPLDSYFAKKSYPQVVKADAVGKQPTPSRKAPYPQEKSRVLPEEKQPTPEEKQPTSILQLEQEPIQEQKPTTNNKNQEQTTNNNGVDSGWLAVSIFSKLGIQEPFLSALANKTPVEMALAMAWWCVSEEWADKPAGLAIKRLQQGKYPPEGFFELADLLIAGDIEVLELTQSLLIGRSDYELNQMFELSVGAAAAARAICKVDPSWFYIKE